MCLIGNYKFIFDSHYILIRKSLNFRPIIIAKCYLGRLKFAIQYKMGQTLQTGIPHPDPHALEDTYT